jgi:transposase
MATVKGYTLKQVAKKVGKSSATIVRWIETKKVGVTKKKTIQGHYIFTEADLQKLKAYNESINQFD